MEKIYEVDQDQKGYQIASRVEKVKSSAAWKQLTPMPYSNHDVFGSELKGKIYIPGGCAPYGFPIVLTNFDCLLIYDTRKNVWKCSSPMKINRRYCNVGALSGKIWVIGGYQRVDGKEYATNSVEIYDPSTDRWIEGPVLDYHCVESVAAVIKERLYVFFSNEDKSRQYAFSIASGESKWKEETAPGFPIFQTDGCVFENKVFIMIPAVGLISYDPALKKWDTDYPPFPNTKAPRASAVVKYKDQIWVISGTDVEDERRVCFYSPKKRKWSEGPKFPEHAFWANGLEVKGKLYVFGGASYSKRHGIYVFRNALYSLK